MTASMAASNFRKQDDDTYRNRKTLPRVSAAALLAKRGSLLIRSRRLSNPTLGHLAPLRERCDCL
jgi:hypothetical protein